MSRTHFIPLLACVFLVVLTDGGQAAADNKLIVGPYIPSALQDSAVIAFELDTPSRATVTIRSDEGVRTFDSDVSRKLHFVSIDGLKPGRVYDYQVALPTALLKEQGHGQLKTASLPGESFSFVVLGDPRPGENQVNLHHAALVEQISLLDPAFSLVLGDLVDDGENPEEWYQFFAVEKEVLKRTALFPVLGDNDHAEGRGLLPRYFPELDKGYYSFVWGGVYFFGLYAWDTKGKQPASEYDRESEQYRWLETELKKEEVQQAPFRVVFIHDPVFISRGRSSRLLQETLAPLFEKNRVDLVFASWHLYERSRVKGVNYVISGGGGAELIWGTPDPEFKAIADANRHHFCRVDVGALGLTLRAIAQDGTVLDQITLSTNLGDDSRDDEFSRFASRMAKHKTYGKSSERALSVYVFDAREGSLPKEDVFARIAESLGATVAVHTYNLRKKAVFDLLLHAQTVSKTKISHLPAVFVGTRYLVDPGELQGALAEISKRPPIDLFQKTLNLSAARQESFAAPTVGAVMVNGLLRNLTVGGALWLLGYGLLLFTVARRGGPLLTVGLGALGGALLVSMIWGIFYFSIIKHVPSPDLFASLFGPRDKNPLFFIIQGMLSEEAYRGPGLFYLGLRTVAFFLPTLALFVCLKRSLRPR